MKKLYYLGPEGSFSHLLASQIKGGEIPSDCLLIAAQSFQEIAQLVSSDDEALGLLVVENSITSDVHEAVDLLFSGKFWISAEAQLKINMNLIALEQANLDSLKFAASKLPALAQCSNFIQQHGLKQKLAESSSAALQQIVQEQDLTTAAIGPAGLLSHYEGVKIVAADIANEKNNRTRFVIVRRRSERFDWAQAACKITVLVELPHKTGSLAEYLKILALSNANLTRIESRPVPGTDWEYQFWIDLECSSDNIEKIIEVAKTNSDRFLLLGVYAKANVYLS